VLKALRDVARNGGGRFAIASEKRRKRDLREGRGRQRGLLTSVEKKLSRIRKRPQIGRQKKTFTGAENVKGARSCRRVADVYEVVLS